MSVYWVDIIEDIVDEVRSDSSNPASGEAPYYLHGHPVDVMNQMTLREKSDQLKFKKWPLIALFQDFEESYGASPLTQSEVSLNIIIATNTKADFFAAQRYDQSFRTTLQPLYELFITKLVSSKKFKDLVPGINNVPHTKIDRLYWGTDSGTGNTSHKFPDYIDAIEIRDLNLKLRKKSNCK